MSLAFPFLFLIAQSVTPIGDVRPERPTFALTPAAPGGRTGNIWIHKSDAGLIIDGHADGPAPAFPARAADIMKSDHVEVWLTLAPNPTFPPLGWGNQFGDNELPKGEASCADSAKEQGRDLSSKDLDACRAWAHQQSAYRVQLKRLFLRQWQFAPNVVVESYATPASVIAKQPLLAPKATPTFSAKPTAAGYDFEVIIPWDAFPPANTEVLRDLTVLVEVFSPRAYSTSAPGRAFANAAQFNHLQFTNPRRYRLSPCEYPAASAAADFFGRPAPAYFFPAASTLINSVFTLSNHREGYAYTPTGASPEPIATRYFTKENLCGPVLRYGKSDLKLDKESISAESKNLDVRRQPDGSILIKSGPLVSYSLFGSGQCGACPRVGMRILSAKPNGVTASLFSDEQMIDQIDDVDYQLTPDWSRITVYTHQMEPARWDAQTHCLQNAAYQPCGPVEHRSPPQPRNIKPGDLK